ncbi:SDR family oxidoreductase [Streptomyces sp. NRRL_ISP-5395]|jgi:3-oxoacyl-[acyl-carrier protein] reductase|uniref:SDR family oxidoreductase n=1 Tax=Streptomyces durocortorensis TaxID=2811104 RepID=A0ABS2I547_9ACTN|nr:MULTISPECIES: SDR family oxidoreductase [Streptomyces]MBM7057763.1 SDR family oxidoreductase [Streptomyces durocortorensis]MCL6288627.1 SDR family oxidoreductase [Streptomyces sp. 43Y-GA-1]MDX2668325.1 SDR family oxidoreductase [Streptomyces sp. NRRL_ISP-5395]MDX3339813.1 SDR family oxidoreductase [Streptomyces sp. ME02-6979.5a]GHF50756.1 putative oxidoreductase YjdA [Streptomyces griseus]
MIDPGLEGKTVLVTGGAMNIGAAISRAFATQGARVAVHYVAAGPSAPLEHARATKAEVEAFVASLPEAVAVEADFLDPGAATHLFKQVEDTLGPVDVLINNAGHAEEDDQFPLLDHVGFERTVRVNLTAPAMLMAEFARRVPEGPPKGTRSVVNISTDAARGFPGQVAYGASKGALESLTRGAAQDLGPTIRVNAVAPGPVQTGWMDDDLIGQVAPSIPLGRVGAPEDIADAVVFLASRQARWITGQVVQVAGGHWL